MINSMRVVIALFLFLLIPQFAGAQLDNSSLNPALEFKVEPDYPSPGESVSITINDYRGVGFGDSIDWFLDGKMIPDTHNRKKITFEAGEVGVSEKITATLTSQSGAKDSLSTTIDPMYMDIIVEPQTHVPDFYRGRALPSVGSTVNLTALINDGATVTGNLVYLWHVNDEVLEEGPIVGRNHVSFITPQGSELIISLQVSRQDGTVLARRTFSAPSVSPQIHFYEVNTLYGTSFRSITKDFNLISNSATIKAEPYYLDSLVYNNPNIREWSINNKKVDSFDQNPYEITLEKTGFSGRADLDFHVRSTDLLLQGARNNMHLTI
jgi:hypothetical protein